MSQSMNMSRRSWLQAALAAGVAGSLATRSGAAEGRRPELKSITGAAAPISAAEHASRLEKLQALMQERKIPAFLVESGSSLEYFTGVRWWRSERTTAAIIPASGTVVLVTPYFEEPSIREMLKVAAEVRPWKEDADPFALLADAVRSRGADASAPLAVEPTTRYFIVERVSQAAGMATSVQKGEGLTLACRSHKSPAELALLQTANEVTLSALRYLHGQVRSGMRNHEILDLLAAATNSLGGNHEFSLVLLNAASAKPHGSIEPQTVHEGSVILIDTGCSLHGYQSDISRTWVLGKASARQRELWDTVKSGQELALQTARPGVPAGAVDRAVREFYEAKGWSRDYGLPGLSHRTGHGIGMDGHEPPYLVRSDSTPLEPGMCFSDEPGLYIPGEFGVRLEDCWYMTPAGPKLFTPLASSLEQPI